MSLQQVPSAPVGALASESSHDRSHSLPLLVLGALGIVYGDIGTSPLYAFREALHAATGGERAPQMADVLGLLSLIVWALTLVVTVKYVLFVLRADNKGEGGTLSLMALARNVLKTRSTWVLLLGVLAAALFFGDAILTPAISVLSAVEGLKIVAPSLQSWVVPITVTILVVLFLVQRFGTGKVSSVFGPITALWFLSIGFVGLLHIFSQPAVLLSVNPLYGIGFLASHPGIALAILGAVFLAVTGAEALYADMGHFGRKPMALAWLGLVFPCLLLNYFGQGAFVLTHPEGAENPFYLMQPDWALLPMVVLATAATVIASQAVISGAFSLAMQAMHLGLLPRLQLQHTSDKLYGQIYMPQINWLLLVGVLLLVLGFRTSSSLSVAYGIAVSGTMVITTLLLYVVVRRVWNWSLWQTLLLIVPLTIFDFGFFIANIIKFPQGGWVPAGIALVISGIMLTWVVGRAQLAAKAQRDELSIEGLLKSIERNPPATIPGTAVFLTSEVEAAPRALLHTLKHFKSLHEHNVILSVATSPSPWVPDDAKINMKSYSPRFRHVTVTFGYMETPNIPRALGLARKLGWKFDIMSTSFFLSRRTLKASDKHGTPKWLDQLFIAIARNASDATEHFHLPTGRVVEIGTQLTI